MKAIRIGELKSDASRVLRHVRERGEEINIARYGTVVARLVPASGLGTRRHRPSIAPSSTLDRVARGDWPELAQATIRGNHRPRRTPGTLIVVPWSIGPAA